MIVYWEEKDKGKPEGKIKVLINFTMAYRLWEYALAMSTKDILGC